jgi:transitional endoplasmic reticulum ATPase
VVFFDEIDAVASERGHGVGDNNVGERVVSQLLTELDGLEELEDVVVIATTNRPDLIDDALLRPGRLDRHVEVADPDTEARREIFEIHTRDRPLAADVDLASLAERTDGLVGADIEAVCREAATRAVREHVEAADDESSVDDLQLTMAQFEAALDEVESAVDDDRQFGQAVEAA